MDLEGFVRATREQAIPALTTRVDFLKKKMEANDKAFFEWFATVLDDEQRAMTLKKLTFWHKLFGIKPGRTLSWTMEEAQGEFERREKAHYGYYVPVGHQKTPFYLPKSFKTAVDHLTELLDIAKNLAPEQVMFLSMDDASQLKFA